VENNGSDRKGSTVVLLAILKIVGVPMKKEEDGLLGYPCFFKMIQHDTLLIVCDLSFLHQDTVIELSCRDGFVSRSSRQRQRQ